MSQGQEPTFKVFGEAVTVLFTKIDAANEGEYSIEILIEAANILIQR